MRHFPFHLVRDFPQDLTSGTINCNEHGFPPCCQDGFPLVYQGTLPRIPERYLRYVLFLDIESPDKVPAFPFHAHYVCTGTNGQDVLFCNCRHSPGHPMVSFHINIVPPAPAFFSISQGKTAQHISPLFFIIVQQVNRPFINGRSRVTLSQLIRPEDLRGLSAESIDQFYR